MISGIIKKSIASVEIQTMKKMGFHVETIRPGVVRVWREK
jgi:hypothetical protein